MSGLDYLLSGIIQLAYLSISPGSFHLNPGEKLSLETSDSLTVTTESDDNMLVVKETEDGQPYEFKIHLFHERENSMTSEAQVRRILKLSSHCILMSFIFYFEVYVRSYRVTDPLDI